MGVIMELHDGGCCWPTTREAVVNEGDDGGNKAAGEYVGHEGVGGSADIYRNMSQGIKLTTLPLAIKDTCLQATSTAMAPLMMTLSDCSCFVLNSVIFDEKKLRSS
ncbi:hypothetical protein Tco_1020298 [Tanacetum coccineum]|uniref:Uncharacterized protein n=1 Tax=Tanacetum coccineum TaxID=301880 RepID=A0ABQ5FZQ9_9ASTR